MSGQFTAGMSRTKSSFTNKKDRPRPDTRNGRVLAALMTGDWISANEIAGGTGFGAAAVEYLRSSYGMEIESKRGRGGGSRLLGEWHGPYFVPIERMDPYPEKVVD